MQVAIITGLAPSSRHGSGVQILRLFEQREDASWCLYWAVQRGVGCEHARALRLERPAWFKAWRARRMQRAVLEACGLSWWVGNEVRPGKLRKALTQRGWKCDVAYITVATEEDACRAASLVAVLGVPYVVHQMDVPYDDGLDPGVMPGFTHLLGQAECVLALSDPIRREVEKFGPRKVELLSFCQPMTPHRAQRPRPGFPLRMAIVGSLGGKGNPAMRLLAESWENILAAVGQMECLYMGQDYEALPACLQRSVRYPGLVSRDQFARERASCHLAFLPAPSRLDCYARFSLPSRLSDYMAAGLPVIACVTPGSAAESILYEIGRQAAPIAREPGQLLAELTRLLEPRAWAAASDRVLAYAQAHFDGEAARERIWSLLRQACGERSLCAGRVDS